MSIDPKNLCTLTDLAKLAKVGQQTVSDWKAGWPGFPKPVTRLGRVDVYDAEEFRTWLSKKPPRRAGSVVLGMHLYNVVVEVIEQMEAAGAPPMGTAWLEKLKQAKKQYEEGP